MYAKVKRKQLTVFDEQGRRSMVTCVSNLTRLSSAFTSQCTSEARSRERPLFTSLTEARQRAAGTLADVATLAAAHDLDLEYTAAIMAGAAQCNKLAEVLFLPNEGCP
jgi:hypothetical protein